VSDLLGIGPLLEYTAWERDKWRAVFDKNGAAFRTGAGPNGDGRLNTVGEIVRHIFSAEKRYPERLMGKPLSETGGVSAEDVRAVFTLGEESRGAFREFLTSFPAEEWDRSREMPMFKSTLMITPRKIVIHTMLHEIRHWAQIATMLRFAGVTDGFHDFLFSPVLGHA